MAGGQLSSITVKINANIDELLAKLEAGKAAIDDFRAHVDEANAQSRFESGGGGGAASRAAPASRGAAAAVPRTRAGRVATESELDAWVRRQKAQSEAGGQMAFPFAGLPRPGVGPATEEAGALVGSQRKIEASTGQLSFAFGEAANAGRDTARATGTVARSMDKGVGDVRKLGGAVEHGLLPVLAETKNVLAGVTGGLGAMGNSIGSVVSTIGGAFTGPLGLLGSVVSFGKQWAIMVPLLFAAPGLLAAIGGAAGGLAASFTVASTAISLFAMGAMTDLGRVTGVSNMAQFDALSAPLQKLYYAYHNLANEWTIMTQTMGGNTTIISVLTGMFETFQEVLTKIGPILGQVASAGQSAFGVLSQGLLGPQFAQFISWVGAEATPVLTTFSQTFVNMASGWTGLMQDLTPAMTLFDNGMVRLTASFANWANSSSARSAIAGFVSYVKNSWGEISTFWEGLGHVFYEFFHSAAQGAPAMAADLGHLFTTIGNGLPGLIQLGETVLPGIVKGFSAFTGGFFSGLGQSLGPLLAQLGGKNGPNWHEIGIETGKIAGDFLDMIPSIAKIVGQMVTLTANLLKIKGVVGDIVKLWLVYKGLQVAGTVIGGIGAIGGVVKAVGGAVGLGGAAAGAAGAAETGGTVAAGGLAGEAVGASLLAAAPEIGAAIGIAALLAWTLHTGTPGRGIPHHRNQVLGLRGGTGWMTRPGSGPTLAQQSAARLGGNFESKNELNSNLITSGIGKGTIIGSKGWVEAIKANTQMLMRAQGIGAGATPKSASPVTITVNSQNTVNVAGPTSPEALQQFTALMDEHDRQLVAQIRQIRRP